MREKVHCKFTK